MVLVAIIAILLSAWLYNREHSNSQSAWTSTQLFALNDSDARRRKAAVENLYTAEKDDLARTVAALAGALSDPDGPVRAAAARSLAHVIGVWGGITNGALIEEIDFATMALIPACRDPRDDVRTEAVQALGQLYDSSRFSLPAPGLPAIKATIGSQARRAVDALLQAMHDPSPQVRAQTLWSFARVGRLCDEDAGPVKVMAEHDPEIKVRIAGVNALAKGWPEDLSLYPFLLGRLKVMPDQEERSTIGWAIGSLAPPPTEFLPALLNALSNALSADDRVLRECIAVALGKLGRGGRPALSALARVARIEFTDPYSSLRAVQAIVAIDPKSPEAQALIEPLRVLIRDAGRGFPKYEAVNILASFGPSPASIKALQEALKSEDRDVRQRAINALARLGAVATSATPSLTVLARDDPDSGVKQSAAEALKRISSLAPANSPPWPRPIPLP